ncbi:MAG: SDR family oxidoreductase [Amylibacter sp.]|jgi:7-alpha-hydroxysteroid dehydrogenase|nr:SDR family oxidoreductase [Amylibacter sp.]
MSFSLEGKTAIITGAANGVGLEIARHFSDHGANVMLVDMDETKLQAEADSIDGNGDNVRYFAGDLRKKLTVANLLSATIDAFDGIDILINASRQVLPSNPLDARDDHFEELFQQNVLANLRVTQAVAKRFISQEKAATSEGSIGAVVNLSSIASDRTHAELLAYSVACAALNQMTRSLAVAFADQRIRVNAIAIGSVMSASLQARLKDDLDVRAATLAATPLGRIAEAREVAETAQFLATDASGFITGQIITVDGGRSLIDPLEAAAH